MCASPSYSLEGRHKEERFLQTISIIATIVLILISSLVCFYFAEFFKIVVKNERTKENIEDDDNEEIVYSYEGKSTFLKLPIYLVMGTLSIIPAYFLGLEYAYLLTTLTVFAMLFVSVIFDLKFMFIPDTCNIIILICGIINCCIHQNKEVILQSLVTGVVLGLLFITLRAIFKGGMGFGDVKLIAVAGFYMGLERSINAFVILGIVSIVLLAFLALKSAIKKTKFGSTPIPYGPALAISFWLTPFISIIQL